MTLLMMANFAPKQWEWQGKQYEADAGQFVTSLESIKECCGQGISIQNIRGALKRFEKFEFLTNKSTKTGRLITIANWTVYQSDEDAPTKKVTKTQQRPNKELTTREEGKEGKNDKNKDLKELVSDYTSDPTLTKSISDFVEYRKTMKKPLTPRGLELTFRNLDKLTGNEIEKADILNQSIANGWQGVFALKNDTQLTINRRKPNSYERSVMALHEWSIGKEDEHE